MKTVKIRKHEQTMDSWLAGDVLQSYFTGLKSIEGKAAVRRLRRLRSWLLEL